MSLFAFFPLRIFAIVEQAIQIGVRHHQAGRLAEAEQLYRQILSRQPRGAQALHMLRVVNTQKHPNLRCMKLSFSERVHFRSCRDFSPVPANRRPAWTTGVKLFGSIVFA